LRTTSVIVLIRSPREGNQGNEQRKKGKGKEEEEATREAFQESFISDRNGDPTPLSPCPLGTAHF